MRGRISHVVDVADLPPLSEGQRRELAALKARPDAQIDWHDIPRLNDAFWRSVVANRYARYVRSARRVSLDGEVVQWLRQTGGNLSEQVNCLLRKAIREDRSGL